MTNVLIIEDEESLRDVYKEEFESEGFTVDTAADGAIGIERLSTSSPDIVILDILMPKMSGFDVLKHIKENPGNKKIPVIVLTNLYTDTRDLIKNWGATMVLLKVNYTPGELVVKVKELMNSSIQPPQPPAPETA